MEDKKEKKGRPKNLLLKTLKKCCSMRPPLNGSTGVFDGGIGRSPKSNSWPRKSPATLTEGCFSVRVGPAKEKYVVRTECLNHPLFRELLDAAEMEYGYAVDGPLELPCDVGQFMRVMEEIENGGEEWSDWAVDSRRPSCNFAYNSYQLLSPSRRPAICRRLFRSSTVDRENEI